MGDGYTIDPKDLVELKNSSGSSLTVHLYGATVISWKCQETEHIFVSSKSLFNNKKAIRGGIPLVFPQFGAWDLGPQHGFARINRWSLKEQKKEQNGDCSAVFTLTDNESTKAMWDFKFELQYTVKLQAESFVTSLKVSNTDSKSFDFTCLLHTYLKVPDVTTVKVTGLSGLTYTDKVTDGGQHKEEREVVVVAENVDRIYENTPDVHNVLNTMNGRNIKIVKTNLPDTVVWNPWVEKAKGMADFGDNDYPEMICVEAGLVSSRKSLSPGEEYTGSQIISIYRED